MSHRREVGFVSVGMLSLVLSVVARADTLVMRDGRRMDGDLVAVREGVIEWEGRRGFFSWAAGAGKGRVEEVTGVGVFGTAVGIGRDYIRGQNAKFNTTRKGGLAGNSAAWWMWN